MTSCQHNISMKKIKHATQNPYSAYIATHVCLTLFVVAVKDLHHEQQRSLD